jgi:protein disulfide-isomerase
MPGFGRCCLLAALVLASACKREPAQGEATTKGPAAPLVSALGSSVPGAEVAWIQGDPERAFARARAEGSLVFLYWGAAWCPPCNELESVVFSKPRFAEMIRGFVPVHLDGDTEAAQRLGEALGVSAYPTILVLGPEREELLRLGGNLDADEIERALAAVRGEAKSFREAAARLSENKARPGDCAVLAHAAWELLPEQAWSRDRVLSSLRKATEVCPAEQHHERAKLAATLLGLASFSRGDAASIEVMRAVEASAPSYLELVFANAETAWAARAFVDHRAGDIASWLFPDPKSADYARWKTRWLAAAASIRDNVKNTSVDVRLWTVVPSLDFHRHESPEGPMPDVLRDEVVRAVERADREARSAFERHAVISGAAYLLRRVGEHEKARRMLLAEAERSDTPFYYWSSLSSLEAELGRDAEARVWSRKARESATGKASRLQWIANDALFHAKIASPGDHGHLLGLAREFYEAAFSLGDGFRGRNRDRAEAVRAALAPFRRESAFVELFERLAARCASLPAEERDACRRHFDGTSQN